MKVRINGKEIYIDSNLTIEDLLKSKGINPLIVVVELNYEVADRENWGNIMLKEGDNVEIVKFMAGG